MPGENSGNNRVDEIALRVLRSVMEQEAGPQIYTFEGTTSSTEIGGCRLRSLNVCGTTRDDSAQERIAQDARIRLQRSREIDEIFQRHLDMARDRIGNGANFAPDSLPGNDEEQERRNREFNEVFERYISFDPENHSQRRRNRGMGDRLIIHENEMDIEHQHRIKEQFLRELEIAEDAPPMPAITGCDVFAIVRVESYIGINREIGDRVRRLFNRRTGIEYKLAGAFNRGSKGYLKLTRDMEHRVETPEEFKAGDRFVAFSVPIPVSSGVPLEA